MKPSRSLCFTGDGLLNSEDIDFINQNAVTEVVLFSDGSREAIQKIREFDTSVFTHEMTRIGLGKTPLSEMRVVNESGTLSRPNYVYDELTKTKWLASKVCAPHMEIYVSDKTVKNATQVLLPKGESEAMCFVAHVLWTKILVIEERMAFPAAVIERLINFTFLLTPETIDIKKLRKESGLTKLDYSPPSEMLSIEVGDDIFTIKLSVLNDIYGELILPFYRDIGGRKYRIKVSVKGLPHFNETPVDISYGLLGKIVEDMKIGCRDRAITVDSLIDPSDLLLFAKKVKIDEETCVWVAEGDTIASTLEHHRGYFIRGENLFDHTSDDGSDDDEGYDYLIEE